MAADARARGVSAGLVAAAGAAWGHQWAGGSVTHVPAATLLIALAAAVVLGLALVRPGRISLPRLALATAGAQGIWHLLFGVGAPAHHPAHGVDPVPMLAVHAGVAAVTLAVCLGADRALLGLARAAVDRLAPPRGGLALPAGRRARAVATPRVTGLARAGGVLLARGPPTRPHVAASRAVCAVPASGYRVPSAPPPPLGGDRCPSTCDAPSPPLPSRS